MQKDFDVIMNGWKSSWRYELIVDVFHDFDATKATDLLGYVLLPFGPEYYNPRGYHRVRFQPTVSGRPKPRSSSFRSSS